MSQNVVLTSHAAKRIKERMGLNKKAALRMSYRAYFNGIGHSELNGCVCQWVNGLYLSRHNANNIKLYGEFAFLFKDSVLLTVLPIPKSCMDCYNRIKGKKDD